MIRIKRDSGYADRLRAYKVLLDGEVIGEISNDQQFEFDAAPGKHQIQLKIDWCTSNRVDFEKEQDTVEFECGSSLRGFRILLSILYVTILRNQYMWLKRKQ